MSDRVAVGVLTQAFLRRIQKELGYLRPDEYETVWRQTRINGTGSTESTLESTGAR